MNLIPWHKHETRTPSMFDNDDFWARLWGNGDRPLTNRLPEVFRGRAFPAINLAETEDRITVTVDCPGLEEDDFEIDVMGNTLMISGERKWEKEKKGKEFHRVESQYGRFERMVQLPENADLDVDKIEAVYKKGVLTINVTKLEKTPTRKIPVHAE